jgi:hypothetical protein
MLFDAISSLKFAAKIRRQLRKEKLAAKKGGVFHKGEM